MGRNDEWGWEAGGAVRGCFIYFILELVGFFFYWDLPL